MVFGSSNPIIWVLRLLDPQGKSEPPEPTPYVHDPTRTPVQAQCLYRHVGDLGVRPSPGETRPRLHRVKGFGGVLARMLSQLQCIHYQVLCSEPGSRI